MASDAARGQKALEANDYTAAITHLTAAITSTQSSGSSTISPLWLIQRSTAYQRTSQCRLALEDAESAHYYATQRGRREQIATAHFRRAVAYHGLGEFGNARMSLAWCRKYNEKEKALTIWQSKVKNDYEKVGGEEAAVNKITAVEVPPLRKGYETNTAAPSKIANGSAKAPDNKAAPEPTKYDTKPTGTTLDKIRVEWYQSNKSVTIDILCKAVPKDQASVKFEPNGLFVKFPVPVSNADYEYNATPLHQSIDVEKCTYRVTPSKVEIVLVKAAQGLKWSEIYGSTSTNDTKPQLPATSTELWAKAASKDPNFDACQSRTEAEFEATNPEEPQPKKESKNWDKILQSDEDAAEDEVEGDPLNHFFRTMYKDADPDTKRAMMKSYTESNGTALSTNWGEVGSKAMETIAPDGMEAKKWN